MVEFSRNFFILTGLLYYCLMLCFEISCHLNRGIKQSFLMPTNTFILLLFVIANYINLFLNLKIEDNETLTI